MQTRNILLILFANIIYTVVSSRCRSEECCNMVSPGRDYTGCPDAGCQLIPSKEGCTYVPYDCFCSYINNATNITSSSSKSGSKSKSRSGSAENPLSYGNCDCNDKMVELRFVYIGAIEPVSINILYDLKEAEIICSFEDTWVNDEITCSIYDYIDDHDDPVYEHFSSRTGFTITDASNYTNVLCSDSFHTSCSEDIVNTYSDSCDIMYASGWKDVEYMDCDDGYEKCVCESTSYDFSFGDHCYCMYDGINNQNKYPWVPSIDRSDSKDGGEGFGDCGCDDGMSELRLIYSGIRNVDISYNDLDNDYNTELCVINDVSMGEEVRCNIEDIYQDIDALPKSTVIIVYEHGNRSNEYCRTTMHTSCSRDIVGLSGDDNTCGTDIIVSGWKDTADDTNNCDDGMYECSCNNGTYIEAEEEPELLTVEYSQCYCSNTNETANINSIQDLLNYTAGSSASGSKSKSKSKSGSEDSRVHGFGDCDCKDGISLLRMINIGHSIMNNIKIFYDDPDGDILCEFNDILPGKEIECDILDLIDMSGEPLYDEFSKNTYIEITVDRGTCIGSWHTSCSQDIVGTISDGCRDIIVSGWQDNEGGLECDDGFDPCDCADEFVSYECEEYDSMCSDAPSDAVENGYCCVTEEGCNACFATNHADNVYFNLYTIIFIMVFFIFIN